MVKELARLRQDTLACEHDHFTLVSQTYELEIQANQLALAHKQKQFQSGISPAQADVSYTNPDSLPYPSVDCIPECRDTPVPIGILQRQVLPWPKPKPWLSKKDVPPCPVVPRLQKDAPPWPCVPRPQPKPRLSLKKTSKVPTSPDVISHQDSAIPSTDTETCIHSPVALSDLNDVTTGSSEVREALSHVKMPCLMHMMCFMSIPFNMT